MKKPSANRNYIEDDEPVTEKYIVVEFDADGNVIPPKPKPAPAILQTFVDGLYDKFGRLIRRSDEQK